jgi:hypothetical protein
MSKKNNLISELNPNLVILRDNKAKWYLPETRRDGYRNLHKINRYGLLFRSDLVLKLTTNINKDIEKRHSVKKITNHKYFCSLLVGKNQEILYEKYANDFPKSQPQTIMSITKMFINLFIGELLEKKMIDLNKNISHYLPDIGTGYASAKIQDVLNMNIDNSYSEDYTNPYASSYLHESVIGWRLPKNLKDIEIQERYLNKIEAKKTKIFLIIQNFFLNFFQLCPFDRIFQIQFSNLTHFNFPIKLMCVKWENRSKVHDPFCSRPV